MATIKSFTSLEQSKVLSKILPLESADMFHVIHEVDTVGFGYKKDAEEFYSKTEFEYLPCWSLAALLNILPYPSLHKTLSGWRCDSYNKEGTSCKLGEPLGNPVDACVETIIKLYEHKRL